MNPTAVTWPAALIVASVAVVLWALLPVLRHVRDVFAELNDHRLGEAAERNSRLSLELEDLRVQYHEYQDNCPPLDMVLEFRLEGGGTFQVNGVRSVAHLARVLAEFTQTAPQYGGGPARRVMSIAVRENIPR